jgi:hypothetical protein
MSDLRHRLIGMGLPCLLALALDATLTMCGQPEEYWAGDYSQTNEGAPFHRKLFTLHPAAAVAGYAAWGGILIGLILLLPEALAVVLAVAVVFGHTVGAYTWVEAWLGAGITVGWFQTARGMFPASAVVLGAGLYWSLRLYPQGREGAKRPWNPSVRWGLIAVLFGTACYMVFFPH